MREITFLGVQETAFLGVQQDRAFVGDSLYEKSAYLLRQSSEYWMSRCPDGHSTHLVSVW